MKHGWLVAPYVVVSIEDWLRLTIATMMLKNSLAGESSPTWWSTCSLAAYLSIFTRQGCLHPWKIQRAVKQDLRWNPNREYSNAFPYIVSHRHRGLSICMTDSIECTFFLIYPGSCVEVASTYKYLPKHHTFPWLVCCLSVIVANGISWKWELWDWLSIYL